MTRTETPPGAPLRVLIADSDPVVRSALRLLLARNPHFRVLTELESLDELQRVAASVQPDLLLLDADLPGLEPARLQKICANLSTVVLSTRDENRAVAMHLGAAAFVCKTESPQHLLSVLQNIATIRSAL